MIIEIEDYNGEQLGYVRLIGTQEFDIEIENPDCDRVSIADIDFDDILETNDAKVRICLENINNK